MGEYAANPLAVCAFGVVFMGLHAYILRRLIKPELVDAQDPHIIQKSFVGVFSYSFGAAAAWFSVPAAFIVYLITPLFFIVPPTRSDLAQTSAAGDVRRRRGPLS